MSFRIVALRPDGSVQVLQVQASTLAHARAVASEMGLKPLASEPINQAPFPASRPFSTREASGPNLLVLSRQIHLLLSAGLNLKEALLALRADAPTLPERAALNGMIERLEMGLPFSQALQHHQVKASPLLVALVRASEGAASLPDALDRYVRYASQVEGAKSKARTALVYPAFLLAVGTLVVAFLMLFVMPRFAGVYDNIRTPLPLAARLMLDWGQWVKAHTWVAYGMVLALAAALLAGFLSTTLRAGLLAHLEKLSWVRHSFEMIYLSRLYRSLSMLLDAGVPLRLALTEVAPLDDGRNRARIEAAANDVASGLSLADSLGRHGLLTHVSRSLLAAGQEAGRVPAMLGESARYLEAEVDKRFERGTRLVEPILMTVMGLLIGAIVMMMYMPIFELAGSMR